MKIETLCKPLKTHGNFETTEFTVDDSPFAFELLIKKLYKNPIQSIVRELASNAWDSHRAAETTDLPIEIDFPTQLDPHLTIKDFGTGLSPKQITDLYTVLFRSNRRNSNSFLGGYGLGSKSPLAYTDQFTVESRYNGVLYSYIVFTGPTGKPTISLATSHPTDEANGLTIKIPVLASDHSTFRNAGRETLIWFPSVKTNIALDYPTPLLETSNGFITNNREFNSNCYARIGTVCYPISTSKLPSSPFTDKAYYYKKGDLYLNFQIGELSIVPNREDLSYDKQTTQRIANKLELVQHELTTLALQQLQTFKTYNEACKGFIKPYTVLESFGWWDLKTMYHPERPKEPLSKFFELSFNDFRLGVLTKTRSQTPRVKYWTTDTVKLDITTLYTLHWLPKDAKYLKDRISAFNLLHSNDEHTHFIIHGGDPKTIQKHFNDQLTTPVHFIDESRPFKPYKTPTYRQETFTSLSGITYTTAELSNLYYVKMENDKSIRHHLDATQLRLAKTTLNQVDFSYPNIILLNKTKWRFAKRCLKNFEETLYEDLTHTIKELTPTLQKAAILYRTPNQYGFTTFLKRCLQLENPKLETIKTLALKYHNVPTMDAIFSIADHFNIDIPPNKTFEDEINHLRTTYHPFIDSEIDITEYPILIDLYQTYLDTLPC